MSVLSVLLICFLLVVLTAITVILFITIPLGISALIVGGSTFSPALAFSLFFTMGKSDNLFVSILIFAVCFFVIKKLIQYRKVEVAIIFHLAVAASAISAVALKVALSIFVDVPAWILLIVMGIVMLFTLSPIFMSNNEKEASHPIITRIIASILYGSAINALLGSFIEIFEISVPDYFTAISFGLWVINSVIAYILDAKLSTNMEFINAVKKIPFRNLLKKPFDKCVNFIHRHLENSQS